MPIQEGLYALKSMGVQPHYSTPSCSNVPREPLKRNGPTRPGSKWQGAAR